MRSKPTASRPAPAQPHAAHPPPPAPMRAPAPAPHAPPHAAPHAPAPHAPAQTMQPSAGPGLLGTMASVAAGSIVGNAVGNMMFGGHGGSAATQAPEQPTAASSVQQNPCAPHLNQFIQCVEVSGNNVSTCQSTWDYVAQCRRSFPQMF